MGITLYVGMPTNVLSFMSAPQLAIKNSCESKLLSYKFACEVIKVHWIWNENCVKLSSKKKSFWKNYIPNGIFIIAKFSRSGSYRCLKIIRNAKRLKKI